MYARMFRNGSYVLEACDGNKTQAARVLAIDYKALLTKLKNTRSPQTTGRETTKPRA